MSSPFLASSTSFIRPAVTAFGKAPFRSRLLQALVRVRSAARAKWFTVQTQNDRDHELAIVRIPRVTRILCALRVHHDVRRGRLAGNSISYRHIYLRRRLSAQTDEAVFSRGTLALDPSDRRCASLSALTAAAFVASCDQISGASSARMAGSQVSPAKVSAVCRSISREPHQGPACGRRSREWLDQALGQARPQQKPAAICFKKQKLVLQDSIRRTDQRTRLRSAGRSVHGVRHLRHSVTWDKIFLFGFAVTH
jgi:hypothetical protein